MSNMINVYIGYDPRETVAFHVLSHSIHARASIPVSITPVMLSQLGGVYQRPRHNLQTTEFSFARFLVPYLSGYQGWSIFMDCDMLVMEDVAELWELRDERYAVQVVKHDHSPEENSKFLHQPQSRYEKKNWSSVMLFNNTMCNKLTPEYVNSSTGLELHQFKWLDSDELIGEIPHKWNYLVGYDRDMQVANAHFTTGGPYFKEYESCEFSREWTREKSAMLYAENNDD